MRTILLLALMALPATAQARQQDSPRPVTDRDVTAADVATTPVNDLNLRRMEIPPLLLTAQERPYDLKGLRRCGQIASAIGELDAVLGDDLDLPQAERQGPKPGKIAQSIVGKFIPFRGVIRELSGANAHQRRIDDAIEAGMARRAFLKGYGQARGCRYPARAAPPAVVAERAAENAAEAQKSEGKRR